MTRAMSLADASYVITFDFLRLPFAAVIGYVAFAELLDPMTLVGSAVIIASTAYFVHRERVTQRQQDQAKTASPADNPQR